MHVFICSLMFTVCSNHPKISVVPSLKQTMLFLSPYNQCSLSTPLTAYDCWENSSASFAYVMGLLQYHTNKFALHIHIHI